MKNLVLIAACFIATLALGQVVNQGKPGTQGPWNVAITSGGFQPDGGFLGTATLIQGPAADGGVSWLVAGSIVAPTKPRWTLLQQFDLGAWLAAGNVIDADAGIMVGSPLNSNAITAAARNTTPPPALAIRPTELNTTAVLVSEHHRGCNAAFNYFIYTWGGQEGPAMDENRFFLTAMTTQGPWGTASTSGSNMSNFGNSQSLAMNLSTAAILPYPGAIGVNLISTSASGTTSCTNAVVQVWGWR